MALCDTNWLAVEARPRKSRRELVHLDRAALEESVKEAPLVVDLERNDPLVGGHGRKRAKEGGHDRLGDGPRGEVVERASLDEPPFGALVNELVEAAVSSDAPGCERLRRRREKYPAVGGPADGDEGDSIGGDGEARQVEGDFSLGAWRWGDVAQADEGDLVRGGEDEEVRDRVDKDSGSWFDESDADYDVRKLVERAEGGPVVAKRVSFAPSSHSG